MGWVVFMLFKEVQMEGTSQTLHKFRRATCKLFKLIMFTDPKPFNGRTYYRIKLVNNDGKVSYSQVRIVGITQITGIVATVYPKSFAWEGEC